MKYIYIDGNTKNYMTTSQVRGRLPKQFDLSGFQKYKQNGSRKTFYLIADIEGYFVSRETTPEIKPSTPTALDKVVVTAYVDGSFNKETNEYGSAAILLIDGEIVAKESSSGSKMNSMRNVAGEISAAALAVKTAEQFLPDELIIRYDYEGVASWPTGKWQAKNDYTKKYAAFMKRKRTFPIRYEHVKAHTGDKYNEMADDLANEACKAEKARELPLFKGSRNALNEQIRRIKYQILSSCMKDIEEFYGKDKHVFKDYLALKAHGTDNVSVINNSCLFEECLTHDEMMYVSANLMEKGDILNALRWTVRGLKVEDAVKKAKVDAEIYRKTKDGTKAYV